MGRCSYIICKHYTILYKGLEHAWVLGSGGFWILRDKELEDLLPGTLQVWDSRMEKNTSQQRGSECICHQTHKPGWV